MTKIEQSIRREHERQEDIYKTLEADVCELIKEVCENKKWLFTHRLKEQESYALKLLTGRTNGYVIDDFLACTIVVPNLREIEDARELIKSSFEVKEEKPGPCINTRPTEFNFDGIRFYCKIVQSVTEKEHSNLIFEIQIKTLLEHAWGEATHAFSYKGDNVSWARERLSAQIKAILNNVDLSIFDMDSVAKSPWLNKQNKQYEEINNVLVFLKKKFNKESGIKLPSDLKRLAEEIARLLKRTSLNLDVLDKALEEETNAGRGYKTRNLSIYSIILLALLNQNEHKVLSCLSRKAYGKNPPKVVIPYETMIAKKYDTSSFKDVSLL